MTELIHPDVKESYGMNERIIKLNHMHRTHEKSLDLNLARFYTKSYKLTEALPPIIRRAMAVSEIADSIPIYLEEGQLFIGSNVGKYKGAPLNPMMSCNWVTMGGGPQNILNDRSTERTIVTDEQQREWMEEISPYWITKTIISKLYSSVPADLTERTIGSGLIEGSFMAGLWGSHNHPDYSRIMKSGYNGIRDYAKSWLENYDPMNTEMNGKDNFYKAVVLEMDALERYAHRCSNYALELATIETNSTRKAELELIAKNCLTSPMEPPKTFYEALQTCWFTELFLYWEGSGGTMGRMAIISGRYC